MRSIALALALASGLAACSNAPSQAQYTVGKTTEAEVLAQRGSPTTSLTLPNLQKVDVYGPDRAPLQDIPVVLYFAPPPSVSAYQFDADNVLVAMSTDASPGVATTGLVASK